MPKAGETRLPAQPTGRPRSTFDALKPDDVPARVAKIGGEAERIWRESLEAWGGALFGPDVPLLASYCVYRARADALCESIQYTDHENFKRGGAYRHLTMSQRLSLMSRWESQAERIAREFCRRAVSASAVGKWQQFGPRQTGVDIPWSKGPVN